MAGMIDPFTGLEIKEITPFPKFEGAARPEPATANSKPIDSATAAQQAPANGADPLPTGTAPSGGKGLEPSSLLDKVMFTLFGTPDSMLSDEDHGKKHQKRQSASAAATSAANDPGESYMGIPVAGGNSLGESLSPILQGIASLFSGGK